MNKIEIKSKKLIIVGIIVLLIILLIFFIVIFNKNDELKENEVKTESNEINENETNISDNDINDVITEDNVLIENNILNENNEEDTEINNDGIENLGDFVKSDKYESVISTTTFYTVKEYIDDFFNCITNSDASKLINILDETYINEMSIDFSNVISELEQYNYSYKIEDIYEYAYTNKLRTFLVEINQNNEKKYIYYALDYSTGAYKIYIGEKGSYVNKESIEKNDYNQFSFNTISDSTMCKNYLNMYIDEINNNLEESYYLLDQEYRKTAFSGIDEYISYINENIEMISNAQVSKYKVVVNADNTIEYTIVDNYNNYYIIYATSVMNYTIRLSK